MILDRSKAPEFKVPEDFELLPPDKHLLSNGSTLYHVQTPGLNAVKIEVIGKGNRASLPVSQTLVPAFTLMLLQEGTHHMTGDELANFFDFHASEVHPITTFGHEGLGLLSTKKHLDQILPAFFSLFTEAIFPEEILAKRKSQKQLSLKLEKEKTSARAGKLFRSSLFGKLHPYGVEPEAEHVQIISQELLKFYYNEMLWQEIEVFVTGDFTATEIKQYCEAFGKLPNRKPIEKVLLPALNTIKGVVEERSNAVQSSIRIGYWSIPKNHPDFIALSVFNTILGGYFGARLIKNIREDKGHTYGIYSNLTEIGDQNYWVIAADVQKEFTQEVIREIYLEIEKLTLEPLSSEELEVVRNYLIGQMLKHFSSSFELIERFRSVHYSGMDLSYFDRKLAYLKSFSSQDMIAIGQKYFSKPPFIEVVVG
ncbi:pitrilysin family protein [Algoriphagus halophytocola]|uniref:M16 family metallopeptidase n=1 Tax=Algoriphagus halophytocola TaxID=2991499 RepID=UPI0022DE68A3|nr:pitrilysin family protein [Algoriphagus sp. TR-M9]WBL41657.1 pitrilysin family protein [Algoriphagus sp. TR-M9]